MLTHTACRHYSSRTHSNGHHGDTFKKVVGVVGGVCLGSFGNIGEKKHAVAFAAGYDHNEYIHYLIEEIVGHAIWHELGHVIHLGGFAAGMLGSLLSAQSLGERDEFYIPKAISKPVVTKCMNHQKGIVEDCLILENGQQIIGQDIIRFYEDLRAAQIVKDLEKRQKDSK
jgi:hypothetical protein